MKRRSTCRGFALSFRMVLLLFWHLLKITFEWRNWVTCDIFGSSIKLWVVEEKPLYVQVELHRFNVLELNKTLPTTAVEIPHLDLLQAQERRIFYIFPMLPPEISGSLTTSFLLTHLFHFPNTESTHWRLVQCQKFGVKSTAFEDRRSMSWFLIPGPFKMLGTQEGSKKVVEWIKVWKIFQPLLCGLPGSPALV